MRFGAFSLDRSLKERFGEPMRTVLRLVCAAVALAAGVGCSSPGDGVPVPPPLVQDMADAATGSTSADTGAGCEVHVEATRSDAIGTVAIVTVTTPHALDEGYIEFGPDQSYGLRAPLNVQASDYRTVLLGMRQQTDYHYRLVARSGESGCTTPDAVFSTGSAPARVPRARLSSASLPNMSQVAPPAAAPGFIITSTFTGSANRGQNEPGYVLIYDSMGELVWWYELFIGSVTKAAMAWDGQSIYARDGNPSGNPGGKLVRITMDGLDEQELTVDTGHHDLAVTDDNAVLLLAGQGRDGCDRIEKLSAQGELSLVYEIRDAFGDSFEAGRDACHCNSIHYHPVDDSITASCLLINAYLKITSHGELVWLLGGSEGQSHFSGDIDWNAQHGHHLINPERLLFFNNGGLQETPRTGVAPTSLAVELQLDLEQMTATRVWTYDGGLFSQTLGDVQRLSNGNTLVTYSNAGVLHEVDSQGELLQTWAFPDGIGYASHRTSLYGRPDVP